MTEADWLTATDPVGLLEHAGDALCERQQRLLACAWARLLERFVDDRRCRLAVQVGERFADGRATQAELISAFHAVGEVRRKLSGLGPAGRKRLQAAEAAAMAADPRCGSWRGMKLGRHVVWYGNAGQCLAMCERIRDVAGNPWCPATLTAEVLAWNSRQVVRIAQEIDDSAGYHDLPILADALEEAGCTSAGILDHCRTGGVHIRGCWVVDHLLGRRRSVQQKG